MDGITVTGRTAALIRWLAEVKDDINGPEKGCIQIDFSGQKATKRLTRVFDN